MPYKLTQEARLNLREIYDYGADNWGEVQSEAYFRKLMAQFVKIADDPYRFPAADQVKPGLRRCVCGAHSIYFEIDDGDAVILAILRSQNTTRIRQ